MTKRSFPGFPGSSTSYRRWSEYRTASRCAADSEDVGCPEPAAVEHRMLSIPSCAASSFHACVLSMSNGLLRVLRSALVSGGRLPFRGSTVPVTGEPPHPRRRPDGHEGAADHLAGRDEAEPARARFEPRVARVRPVVTQHEEHPRGYGAGREVPAVLDRAQVRFAQRMAVDEHGSAADLDRLTGERDDPLDVVLVAAPAEPEPLRQPVPEGRRHAPVPGRLGVVEHDDVPPARGVEHVGEPVHQHSVARLQRGNHGRRGDVERLDQEGLDEERQDERDDQQDRKLAEESPLLGFLLLDRYLGCLGRLDRRHEAPTVACGTGERPAWCTSTTRRAPSDRVPKMGVQVGIGLFTGQLPPGSGRTFAREYRETLDLVRLAEALGFDSAWVSEHHGSSDGYLPSLLPMLAGFAAATDRIRLGTGVVLAPFHEPLRLA